ncbi:hypothetical protein Tmar_1002 [Thermaerobacter marianensis DSM 12885]|uniref:Uncharacterized protein n=1 Tax=Thermaerobacter marianensis (strain ATCC 700841 / DSM 12885 / JCM 10246 / 7p75a) TaxID=644966 RepID=E6SJQ2_THEM7|nr:hypothetical protein Tmar_1002 [Thermaerobacter marianensis DSM 12885]
MRGFWLGFACGLLVAVLVAGAGVQQLVQRGLTVEVAGAPLAAAAEAGVAEAVARRLPAMVAPLREQLPAAIAARLAARLREAGISVYGIRLELPPDAAAALENQLREELTRQLDAELDPQRLAAAAGPWSRRLGRELVDALATRLAQQPVPVRPVDRLPLAIPVYIRLNTAGQPAFGAAGSARSEDLQVRSHPVDPHRP